MTALISIIGLLAFFALGAFTLYMLIDFSEYLKRFHGPRWRDISFERPFGISQDDFYFHPVRPLRLVSFLFSSEDSDDANLTDYKKKIKLALGGLLVMLVIFFATSLIG